MVTKDKQLRQVGEGRILQSPWLARGSHALAHFFLGAVLAGAGLPGGYSPMAVAFVGASGSGVEGVFALLGAAFGAMCFREVAQALRDIAAAVLVYSVAFAFFDLKVYRRSWFMPAVTASICAVTGFLTLSESMLSARALACYALSCLLAGAGTRLYRLALGAVERPSGEELSPREQGAVVFCGGVVLMALSHVRLLNALSLGRLLSMLTVLAAALLGGPGGGAAVGVCVGLAVDLSLNEVLCALVLGSAGVLAGAAGRQGRWPCALAFFLAQSLGSLWLWERAPSAPDLLWESLLAAVLFATLPEKPLRWLRSRLLPPTENTGRRWDWTRERLEGTARAFRAVYDALRENFTTPPRENGEDPARVFERAADRVCVRCALREDCWQKNYQATAGALGDAVNAMLEKGKAEAGDLPQWFASRCVHLADLLTAANRELELLLCRRRCENRVWESRAAVCRQYAELSRVLEETAMECSRELTEEPVRERRVRQYLAGRDIAGECAVFYDRRGRLRLEILTREGTGLSGEESRKSLCQLMGVDLHPARTERERGRTRLIFEQAEPLAVTAGIAAKKRDGETVSGDAGAWFKGEDGVLWLLLCDGMGSGEAAGRESELAIRLLERFLRAGVEAQPALKTLNSALALRGEAGGGFTTVDLCRLDLFTGEGTLYKFGAAPTYLKKGGTVLKVTGSALPAGLADPQKGEPDAIPFHLDVGESAVLLTDGVSDGEEDEWLRQKLLSDDGASPKRLARELLEESLGRDPGGDDKTVMVLRVGSRKH